MENKTTDKKQEEKITKVKMTFSIDEHWAESLRKYCSLTNREMSEVLETMIMRHTSDLLYFALVNSVKLKGGKQ
jgi:hypothetical protein